MAENLFIEFEDNNILQLLYGPQNSNLKKLETKLDISISNLGNRMVFDGSEEKIRIAKTIITEIYEKLEKSGFISDDEIETLIDINNINKEQATDFKKPDDELTLFTKKIHVRPRSCNQAEYVKAMKNNDLVFGIGPAGTGKTYLAVALAVTSLIEGKSERIIISRPAVEAGEHLGFLPGDLKEKVDPYLRPLYDALYCMLPPEQVRKSLQTGEIEVAPLAFMRGRTLSNSTVILDEAQNTTKMQMKMFLTRLGNNSKMIINGDLSQTDLPKGTSSGLSDAIYLLKKTDGVKIIEFTDKDVVRHDLVSRIIKAYEKKS